MAFAVTAVKAWGKEIDEATTKKFHQYVKLVFTRTSNADGTVNLASDTLTADDFWSDAELDPTYAAIGKIAHGIWKDVKNKAEMLEGLPSLTQQVSTTVYPTILTPSSYTAILADADVSIARNYTDGQMTFTASSQVDLNLNLYDAATGTTVITCTLLAKYILQDGQHPSRYGV